MIKRCLVAIALTTALVSTGSGPFHRGPASATEHEPPNILIIVTDDQRYEGTMAALPSVARWFGEQGTEFSNAYATTPLCCPSRASILTGRYPHNHSVYQNGREARARMDFDATLPAFLKQRGYRTGLFGKFFNRWPYFIDPPYFDRWAMSGSGYIGARFNMQGDVRRVKRYSTHVVSDRASRFLARSIESDQPWFMYVAPVAAHSPFSPEAEYVHAAVPLRPYNPAIEETDLSDKPPWVADRPGAHPDRITEMYLGQLRTLMSVDDMVDRLFTELEAAGEADNTIAVFTSDNGFLWGEHGLSRKKHPYLPSIEVPLFLRWPGHAPEGLQDPRIAANIDIAPTVLQAAGIEPPEAMDGIPLIGPNVRRNLFLEYRTEDDRESSLPNWDAIINLDHQYIVYSGLDGTERFREYYDLRKDPSQLTNLLGDADPGNDPPAALVEALDAQIQAGRACKGTTCWLLP